MKISCAWGVLVVWLSSMLLSTSGSPLAMAAQGSPTPDILPTPPPMPTASRTDDSQRGDEVDDESIDPRFTEEPTTPIGMGSTPDYCETGDAPCSLALNQVHGPFTFLPAGDRDVYQIDRGVGDGLATQITLRATARLDVYATVLRGTGEVLGVLESDTLSMTVAAEVEGMLRVVVENRSPEDPTGETYVIELRQVMPPPSSEWDDGATPDALENNWDFAHATDIAPQVAYELNFVCPDPRDGACAGGDHDFMQMDVKAGIIYRFATFDLGPGVDTQIDLFWGSEEYPVASNDDFRAPHSYLSALTWEAPDEGTVVVRIGPRTGTAAHVFAEDAYHYRFAVALVGSAFDDELLDQIRVQTGQPTVVADPAPSTPAQSPPQPSASTTSTVMVPTPVPHTSDTTIAGRALVVTATELLVEPHTTEDIFCRLAPETIVTLTGQMSREWVQVQADCSVLPGWVDSRTLAPVRDDASVQATATVSVTGQSQSADPDISGGPSSLESPTATPLSMESMSIRVDPRSPVPLPTAVPLVPQSRTITVLVCARPNQGDECQETLSGVLVEWLHDATQEVLTAARTGPDGSVTLTVSVPPVTHLLMRLSTQGIVVPTQDQETITVFL